MELTSANNKSTNQQTHSSASASSEAIHESEFLGETSIGLPLYLQANMASGIAGGSVVQRQTLEDEEEEEEEPIQPMYLNYGGVLQRQPEEEDEEEEELLQTKSLTGTELVQRQAEEEEEEELLQTKSLTGTELVQRQAEEEEEEELLQTKSLTGMELVQRQAEEEEEEELLQTKSLTGTELVQRQVEEEEEEELLQPKMALQAKLVVGPVDDPYEREADSVAAKVMSQESGGNKPGTSASTIQRKCSQCELEEDTIQAKGNQATNGVANNVVQNTVSSPGTGKPLSLSVRKRIEPVLGSDLSHVRVHDDDQAGTATSSVNARAFTHKNHIWLGKNEHENDVGLLAHEATHVVQQSGTVRRLPVNVIQRDGEGEEGEGEQGEGGMSFLEYFGLRGVEAIKANMESRFQKVTDYASDGKDAADVAKEKLLHVADNYSTAWEAYSDVITAGRLEAQNQEQWINICVGIGAGLIIGVGAAWVLPTTAAGAFFIAAGEWAGVIGSALGQAAGGAIVSTPIAGALAPAGTNMQPEGTNPAVFRMRIWRNISDMYSSALKLTETGRSLHSLTLFAETLRGEIRVQLAGGESELDQNELVNALTNLSSADVAFRTYDGQLERHLTSLADFATAADSLNPEDYPASEMEKDIWILWISSLDDPSVLDLDEIEDYLHGTIGILGENSRLGVDFGGWTTEDDENEARAAARSRATDVRRRVRQSQDIQPRPR